MDPEEAAINEALSRLASATALAIANAVQVLAEELEIGTDGLATKLEIRKRTIELAWPEDPLLAQQTGAVAELLRNKLTFSPEALRELMRAVPTDETE